MDWARYEIGLRASSASWVVFRALITSGSDSPSVTALVPMVVGVFGSSKYHLDQSGVEILKCSVEGLMGGFPVLEKTARCRSYARG